MARGRSARRGVGRVLWDPPLQPGPKGPGLLLTFGLLAALAACSGDSASELHVRVLAIHDFHGSLRPTEYSWSNGRAVGGAVALKAAMDSFEAACACTTVRLDGGDEMQGTLESNLTAGASTVEALNYLGLDAAAVGNHELDWGVQTLITRQGEARYPWLAANVFLVDGGTRPEWAKPFAIVEKNGIKVGVVGYATVSTPGTLRPETTKPYEFRSGYAAIRDALDAVHREGPDFVAIVAHAGGQCSAEGCSGEMVDLARELPPGTVHLIVGGHNHNPGEGVVNDIPIVRAGSNGRGIGIVDLYRQGGRHTFKMSQQVVYADEFSADEAMAKLIAPYLLAADAKGREQITTFAEPVPAADRRLGTLIADAARVRGRADVGMHNPGGVRADLPRGPISYADLHRVSPFDNALVRLTLTGAQLTQLVGRTGAGFYYSNLRIEPANAAPGSTIVSLRLQDGTAIRDEASYTLATADFLADGGDGLTMLMSVPREATGLSVLEALVEHVRSLPSPVVLK